MRHRFFTLDVFTERPLAGNPLAVVQGYAMGRPSQIRLGRGVEVGALVRATIGGAAVVVSEGTLRA
jgi:trans-2,3-dihydro-3-hydroxyanthranilate isomerase